MDTCVLELRRQPLAWLQSRNPSTNKIKWCWHSQQHTKHSLDRLFFMPLFDQQQTNHHSVPTITIHKEPQQASTNTTQPAKSEKLLGNPPRQTNTDPARSYATKKNSVQCYINILTVTANPLSAVHREHQWSQSVHQNIDKQFEHNHSNKEILKLNIKYFTDSNSAGGKARRRSTTDWSVCSGDTTKLCQPNTIIITLNCPKPSSWRFAFTFAHALPLKHSLVN